jgi:hypothetical protein
MIDGGYLSPLTSMEWGMMLLGNYVFSDISHIYGSA